MKKLFALALMTLGLTSCASAIKDRDARLLAFKSTIPTCSGEAQCTAAWETAQVWVAQNSRLKIQTATSVLIETYGGGQYDATLAMRVIKEPQGNGVYRIVFSGGCNNVFGCSPEVFTAGIQFNSAIKRAIEIAVPAGM